MNSSPRRDPQRAAAASKGVPTSFISIFRKTGTRSLVIALLALCGLTVAGTRQAHAQAWSLTTSITSSRPKAIRRPSIRGGRSL